MRPLTHRRDTARLHGLPACLRGIAQLHWLPACLRGTGLLHWRPVIQTPEEPRVFDLEHSQTVDSRNCVRTLSEQFHGLDDGQPQACLVVSDHVEATRGIARTDPVYVRYNFHVRRLRILQTLISAVAKLVYWCLGLSCPRGTARLRLNPVRPRDPCS